MVKRQVDRLKDVVTELINSASNTHYEGDIAHDFPREWNKILRITELHPDNKKAVDKDLFKGKGFSPLVDVTELSDKVIGAVLVVESAGDDKELLPLKVTAYDNDKKIVTGELSNTGYEMGFMFRSIRGHKS